MCWVTRATPAAGVTGEPEASQASVGARVQLGGRQWGCENGKTLREDGEAERGGGQVAARL